MLRPVMLLALLLLTVTAVTAGPLAPAISGASTVFQTGPTYHYTLKEDKNPVVCKHMLSVFNDKFTRLWDAPPMTSLTNDPIYSGDGKYGFPRLTGVKYNAEVTFHWRFFAQPTSPEFSAINWKVGMAVLGGCSSCSWDYELFPILVTHIDFENNGTTDTVMKQGYFPGYPDVPTTQEYLIVWRDQVFTIRGVADLSKLEHPHNQSLTPIISWGMYLRPFIYAKHTYVLRYVQDEGQPENPSAEPVIRAWTWQPHREDMVVQEYSFTGQKEKITERPEWTIHTVCDFEMKQLNDKQESEHGH